MLFTSLLMGKGQKRGELRAANFLSHQLAKFFIHYSNLLSIAPLLLII